MRKVNAVVPFIVFSFAALSSAQVAIDNGPFETHSNGGPGGAPRSVLQNDAPLLLNVFGFGCQSSSNNHVADNFVVPALNKLIVQGYNIFAYQTGATGNTINTVRAQVLNGAPNAGGTVVFGDLTTNLYASTTSTNVYRVDATSTPTSNRLIHRVAATVAVPQTLNAGTYWLNYQLSGTAASGPWAVPVTILGQGGKTGGNGIQFSGAANVWQNLVDNTFAQDVAFQIRGLWLCDVIAFTVEEGIPFGGTTADLRASDDAKVFVLMDEGTPNSRIRFDANTDAPNFSMLQLTYEGSATRNDLSQFIDFLNTSNVWEQKNFSLTTLTDTTRIVTEAVNPVRFRLAGGDLRARVRTIPTSDLEAADGWSQAIDFVQWRITPL